MNAATLLSMSLTAAQSLAQWQQMLATMHAEGRSELNAEEQRLLRTQAMQSVAMLASLPGVQAPPPAAA